MNTVLATPQEDRGRKLAAQCGALLYVVWGVFHLKVAYDIYKLGMLQTGISQGRIYQLAAYMFTIALFVIAVAVILNRKNSSRGFWLNLCVAGWADLIWVLVVVLPGYVDPARGLLPPAIFVAGALATMYARGGNNSRSVHGESAPRFKGNTVKK